MDTSHYDDHDDDDDDDDDDNDAPMRPWQQQQQQQQQQEEEVEVGVKRSVDVRGGGVGGGSSISHSTSNPGKQLLAKIPTDMWPPAKKRRRRVHDAQNHAQKLPQQQQQQQRQRQRVDQRKKRKRPNGSAMPRKSRRIDTQQPTTKTSHEREKTVKDVAQDMCIEYPADMIDQMRFMSSFLPRKRA